MKGWHVPLWLELSATVLVALTLSNALTYTVAEHRRADSIRSERLQAIEGRLSALVELMSQLPAGQWNRLLTVASVRHERVSLATKPSIAQAADRDDEAEARLRGAMSFGPGRLREVRVAMRGRAQLNLLGERRGRGHERFDVAISLGTGRWLNAEFRWPDEDALLPGLVFSAAVSMLALALLGAWTAFRLYLPLQKLAAASQLMQAGHGVAPLRATGPAAVRRVVRSFNDMAQRLMPMFESQRVALASVGHDLRTPITALRLKSEFIDDDVLKHEVAGTLDELQTVTEAALAAARSGLSNEAVRRMDVVALVDSLCSDLVQTGAAVAMDDASPLVVACRPSEITRAVRNLVENAVRHGGHARVRLLSRGEHLVILVEDDGPGIPAADMPRVFDPFVRLRPSVDAGVQGHGLGLTIARAIARAHGGDVALSNRCPNGLRAEFTMRAC